MPAGELVVPAFFHGGTINLPPDRLVIHTTEPGLGYPASSAPGQARATARYFQSPNAGGSAHHVADIAETVRCLADNQVGYHAPPNLHSLGYEICGEVAYTRDEWLSPQVWPAVVRVAVQVKADAAKYNIPAVKLTPDDLLAGKRGICGHVDVSNAWHQTDHTDPGPNFPWDRFMQLVTGGYDVPLSPDDLTAIGQVIDRHLAYALGYLELGQENSVFNLPGQPANLIQMQADIAAIKQKLGI